MKKDDIKKKQLEIKKAADALNLALSTALKLYREQGGNISDPSYFVQLRDEMTTEEELFAVFEALVQSGLSPEEAKTEAPKELKRIYEKMLLFEEVNAAAV